MVVDEFNPRSEQICAYCVMDTTDPEIEFDSNGRCNHCRLMESTRGVSWFSDNSGLGHIEAMREQLRSARSSSGFDCILGLSGGVDSSFVAMKLHEWGIRPLVVHVDAGWNSELSVMNIKRVLDYCGWELHTDVVNWEAMRSLQLAFMRSGVANQDVPQDHAFFSSLYHFATTNKIRHVISGGNDATEGILPESWGHSAMDARNLKAIWKRFGDGNMDGYPTISFGEYYLYYPQIRRMTTIRPLNMIPYDKAAAVIQLQDVIGWRPYDRKHGESLFTKFFQNYYLPTRYGYDKRRAHLSSMIVSGQIDRNEAIRQLAEPLYEPDELERDIDYVTRKLRIDRAEFDRLMEAPRTSATSFPNWDGRRRALKAGQRVAQRLTGKRFNVYS